MSNQFQHNLQQYEVTPPQNIWLAIEERLVEDEGPLQDRLIAFEATPPSAAWQQIEAAITEKESEVKTIGLNNKWMRYVAAAVVLGLVAISIFTFVFNKSETSIAEQPSYQNPTNTTLITQPSTQQNEISTPSNGNENTDRTTVESNTDLQSGLSNTLASTTTKRYKVVAKEDGKLVRFSQKALAVFDCAIKETANKNVRCKENIQSMQEKMATSMVSPSADFAGLIDMIKTLEENK